MTAPGNPKGVNHKKGKGQGKAVAPRVRGAFLRALKQLEEEGYPLSEILAQKLLEKPLETLTAIARFIPAEMMLEAPEGSDVMMAFVRVPAKDPLPEPEPDAIDGEFVEVPRLRLNHEVSDE